MSASRWFYYKNGANLIYFKDPLLLHRSCALGIWGASWGKETHFSHRSTCLLFVKPKMAITKINWLMVY